jgi:transcriptional regulator with XRE-family HTH domain
VRQVSDEGSLGRLKLARLLAGFRLARGLSQEELAHRSGMSVRAIRNLEHGQVGRPHRSSIALLADALTLTDAEHAAVKDAVVEAERHALAYAEALPLASPRIAPSQLPPDIEDFTGRDLALHQLSSLLRRATPECTGVLITAIMGKAGVGKTTLAVHAAHRARSSFPDGQLHVNLRGVEARALDPADVLSRFLRAFGVEGPAIPEDVDERAGLFRSLMADRRALVLLDNAADEEQVRPLLPAGARNAVIITSRVRLAGLFPREVIDLDVLPPEHAKELLRKIVGADRLAREPDVAAKIMAICGNLPLALRIVGAKAAAKPHWRLQRLTDRLGVEHLRLDELAAGDLEVRASVALSYRGLGVVERRAFRLLGLLQAPDFAPMMISALLDVPDVEADDIAERLADAQLLDAIGVDTAGQLRYRLHALLRAFARERLAIEETPSTRRAAMERTLLSDAATVLGSVRQLRLRPVDRPAQTASAPINGTEPVSGMTANTTRYDLTRRGLPTNPTGNPQTRSEPRASS